VRHLNAAVDRVRETWRCRKCGQRCRPDRTLCDDCYEHELDEAVGSDVEDE
jgi:uncharacterized OB-fold protein